MDVERLDIDDWRQALPATGFEVFHSPAALSALETHADGELRLYGGFKGNEAVGLLPVLVQDRFVGTAALSPPPARSVPRLGPVLMPNSPKRRKQEQVNRRFVTAVLEEIQGDGALDLLRMLCSTSYTDPRPFQWEGFDVATQFTYRLDLADTDAEAVRGAFSSSLRRDLRDAAELDVTVEREGLDGARAVYEQTRDRYAEQGESFSLPWPYVRDLVTGMREDDRVRVYVARDGAGEFLTGITVLYSNDAGYFWQGGARTVHEGVGLNSYLHWHVIEDVLTDPPRETVTAYDLMGANTERLCEYKGKFGAELVPYYVVESGGAPMSLAKRTYRAFVD